VASNLDRFRADLESLADQGKLLEYGMRRECSPTEFDAGVKKQLGAKADEFLKNLPAFSAKYQSWYSEAFALLKQVLPDRVADFARHYEKPKARKEITFENYHIEDFLQGLRITSGWEKKLVVDQTAAIPRFQQQLSIVEAAKRRFESSLFDIQQLVRADLFDSELDAARELAKHKFGRAAGAVSGVVLEKHLQQVCQNRSIKIPKKSPTIADLNDALKNSGAIDMPQWRYVQHLGDLRNLCDHNKAADPTATQVADLIDGVDKVIKTVF
jgi:hypothetical protein